jgi:hypothetical protein
MVTSVASPKIARKNHPICRKKKSYLMSNLDYLYSQTEREDHSKARQQSREVGGRQPEE